MEQSCCNDAWHRRKYCGAILAVTWAIGLLGGMDLASCADTRLSDWMQKILWGSVSLGGLFGIYFLPYIFTVYAAMVRKTDLLYGICLVKAVLYGFVCQGISVTYGSSGWLLLGTALFCDRLWLIWLHMLWQHILLTRKCIGVVYVLCGTVLCMLLSAFDYCVISPFLTGLIKN